MKNQNKKFNKNLKTEEYKTHLKSFFQVRRLYKKSIY